MFGVDDWNNKPDWQEMLELEKLDPEPFGKNRPGIGGPGTDFYLKDYGVE